MSKLFSLKNSLEVIAALFTIGAGFGVLQTFIVGKHFVIPTMILLLAAVFGNLARFGVQGKPWAKHTLFWMFSILACHAFFALFWAGPARPGEFFGSAFYPVYGFVFVGLTILCWIYARENRLFSGRN